MTDTAPEERAAPLLAVQGKCALVWVGDEALPQQSPLLPRDGLFVGHWANTNDVAVLRQNIAACVCACFWPAPLSLRLVRRQVDDRVPSRSLCTLRELSFTLTPAADDVVQALKRFYTFRRHRRSVKSMAEESNALLLEVGCVFFFCLFFCCVSPLIPAPLASRSWLLTRAGSLECAP